MALYSPTAESKLTFMSLNSSLKPAKDNMASDINVNVRYWCVSILYWAVSYFYRTVTVYGILFLVKSVRNSEVIIFTKLIMLKTEFQLS